MKKIYSFCFLCALLVAELASCRAEALGADRETVLFRLPEWPEEAGFCLAEWRVKISCGTEDEVRLRLEPGQRDFYAELDKNSPSGIIAQPVVLTEDGSKSDFFKPAGAVYPYCFETSGQNGTSGEAELSWENGFAASLMEQLCRAAAENGQSMADAEDFIAAFNWKKLTAVIQEKTGQSVQSIEKEMEDGAVTKKAAFYNPWLTDTQAILEGIGYNSFRATLLNMKNAFTAEIPNEAAVSSAYMPENRIYARFNRLSLKKNCQNFFSLSNTCGIIVTGNSANNLSLELISLPIYIDEV